MYCLLPKEYDDMLGRQTSQEEDQDRGIPRRIRYLDGHGRCAVSKVSLLGSQLPRIIRFGVQARISHNRPPEMLQNGLGLVKSRPPYLTCRSTDETGDVVQSPDKAGLVSLRRYETC